MPRDSSGNYTLPAGNPVVTDTVIDSNWANTTLADIATQLNNVLTRDGLLGTTGPFTLVNGSAVSPGLAFNSRSDVGLYLTGTEMGLSFGGVPQATISGTGVALGDGSSAVTQSSGTNDNKVATTAFVQSLVGGQSFAAGTRLIFAQASAPIGWMQDTSDTGTNRMLRVVNTAGGGGGGTMSPIMMNVVPAHTHGLTTGPENSVHTHGVNDPGHGHTFSYEPMFGTSPGAGSFADGGVSQKAVNAGTTGISLGTESATHTHSATTDSGSSATNWAPRYLDTILCIKL